MILKCFSPARAKKLSKMTFTTIREPIDMKIIWLQYEDFNSLSYHFNNKLHKHNFCELHLILDGNGIINYNNQKEHTVHAEQAIFIPQNSPHVFTHKAEKLKRFSVAFTLQKDIMSDKAFVNFFTAALSESVIENLNTIFSQAEKNTASSLYIIKNRLCEILCEILNLDQHIYVPLIRQSNNINLYIDKSKKYIDDNLNIALTCKDIANYCGLNEIYLNRIFKKNTGETLLKYIHRKKINYSIDLLKNKGLSLSEISAILGFSNEYYFNTFFKKSVGMPPGTYRNICL